VSASLVIALWCAYVGTYSLYKRHFHFALRVHKSTQPHEASTRHRPANIGELLSGSHPSLSVSLPFPSPRLIPPFPPPFFPIPFPGYPYPPLAPSHKSSYRGPAWGSAVSSSSMFGQSSPATKCILVQRRSNWVEGLAIWLNIITNLHNL